jgi:type IV fimbrial biogenesis protein FimT
MHYNYPQAAHVLQKAHPFICHKTPSVWSYRPVIIPSIGCKQPFVGNRGFTLIELIITLTIVGILTGLAAPSMFGFVASNRLASQINELIADTNLARSEAIKRVTNTGICATAVNGSACAVGGNWANGWLVYYVDPVTAVNVTIKTHEPLSGNNTLTAPSDALIFNKSGFLTTATGNFQLCDSKLHKSRLVDVRVTGRPALTEGTC